MGYNVRNDLVSAYMTILYINICAINSYTRSYAGPGMTVRQPVCLTNKLNAMQCNALQYNIIQYDAMQWNAMQCDAMQYNTQYNIMQCYAIQYDAMQWDAIQYNVM